MTIAVHTIKPSRGAKHSKKRVGRGDASGHGTYSTRGGKGQTARSGGSRGLKMKAFKRLMQSTPKLRGFKSLKIKPITVTLLSLNKFNDGETVNLTALREKKLIGKNDQSAKIVLTGELKKKLIIDGLLLSKTAKEAIIKSGGEVK